MPFSCNTAPLDSSTCPRFQTKSQTGLQSAWHLTLRSDLSSTGWEVRLGSKVMLFPGPSGVEEGWLVFIVAKRVGTMMKRVGTVMKRVGTGWYSDEEGWYRLVQ